MKKTNLSRLFAATALALATLCGQAQAGVLLGTGNLEREADLTRVAGAGGTLEFLDLTTTRGWAVDEALFAFGSQGFRVADGNEMRELMGAFNITYVVTANYLAELPSTLKDSTAFVDYVGATWGDAAFGMSYEATRGMLIFSCISGDTCGEPRNYVAMEDFNFGNELMGVYLVRDAAAIPVPAPLALLGAAGLALAALRRRRA
jgi:hypothetical protein